MIVGRVPGESRSRRTQIRLTVHNRVRPQHTYALAALRLAGWGAALVSVTLFVTASTFRMPLQCDQSANRANLENDDGP
jgi:hypothetical protein